jgi:hypothetical protein
MTGSSRFWPELCVTRGSMTVGDIETGDVAAVLQANLDHQAIASL